MSRSTLCLLTALALVLATATTAVVRLCVLGYEAHFPVSSHTYKVTLFVRGMAKADARLVTACPLDFHRQHVFGEEMHSDQMIGKHAEARTGARRQIHWLPRPNLTGGTMTARYHFYCNVEKRRITSSMARVQEQVHTPPKPGEHLDSAPGIDPSLQEITDAALELTEGLSQPLDQVRALFQFVDVQVENEPSAGPRTGSALECLQNRRGDAIAQSRLLVALCRNRGIPTRLVWGLILQKDTEQKAHPWVEAWVDDRWFPLCAFHHHCGAVPSNYLVFGHGDIALVRGINIRDLDYACLVEHLHRTTPDDEPSLLRRYFRRLSLYALPPAEGRLVEFLLLLPVAALIICVFRNLIGMPSFGTFTPALIGLAFRKWESLPGLGVFVAILLVGWGMRRLLDRYHLLQVPRTAFMLTLVVTVLIGFILVANYRDVPATHYISLFPMVILTGMIERFWTLEIEDSAWTSFKTLLSTLLIAICISMVLSLPALVKLLLRFPETLGVILAAQLLLGRYTGYRLTELIRFRDLIGERPAVSESLNHRA